MNQEVKYFFVEMHDESFWQQDLPQKQQQRGKHNQTEAETSYESDHSKKKKIALVCSVEFVNYFSYFKINVMNVQISQNNPKVFNNSSWAYLTIPKQAINGKIPQMFCN